MFSGHRLNKGSVVSQFRERMKGRTVVASIHDFQPLSKDIARVVVTFNTNEADAEVMREALAATMDFKALPIEGTFRWVHSYSLPAAFGFVKRNCEIRPYEEASAKKMKAMASNLLMDTEDESLWEVRSGGKGEKTLVRQGLEDLSELLVTASVRQYNAPEIASIRMVANRGDFVAFVDPQTAEPRYGYVLAQEYPAGDDRTADALEVVVFDPVDEEVEDVNKQASINDNEEMRGEGNKIAERLARKDAPVHVGQDFLYEATYLNGMEKQFEAIAAPTNQNLKSGMMDYYKKLFSYAPDYYEQVKKIIEGRAAM